MRKLLTSLVLLVASSAFAQVNLNGATVNASVGYQLSGNAPNGHVLCGNGLRYVDAASCGSTTIYAFDGNFTTTTSGSTVTVHLATNITVNAATASALSTAFPVQCGGSLPMATGIQANGTANCTPVPGPPGTLTDVTGSRAFGTTFTNGGTAALYVSGFGVTTTGGDTSQIDCTVNGIPTWGQQANATVVGAHTAFTSMVPAGGTYVCVASGTTAVTLGKWTELVL